MVPLDRQHVLITGAAHGLGHALARAFAQRGARLSLMDNDAPALSALAADIGAIPITVDLCSPEKTQAASAALGGPVDVLIHSAAILETQSYAAMPVSGWERTMGVGLNAAFQLSHALWPEMQQRGGTLIFVSSQSGIKGFVNESAYCAAKHGLEGLSKCLAMEGAPHGILSVTITPGMAMKTPMSERNYPPDLKKTWVDPIRLAPAFVHIAQTRDMELSGKRLNAWDMSQALEGNS